MGDRWRLLVHTPGDPPVCTVYAHWGGENLSDVAVLLRGLEHSTAYATARAVQRLGNWLDSPFASNLSLGLEPPVPVAEAESLAFGVDFGVLVFDWRSNSGFVVDGSITDVP